MLTAWKLVRGSTLVEDGCANNDSRTFFRGIQMLGRYAHRAPRSARDQVLPNLIALLPDVATHPGGYLARTIGSLIGMDGPSEPALDLLVERACTVFEDAGEFVVRFRDLVGDDPSDDPERIQQEYDRFVELAPDRAEAERLAVAWRPVRTGLSRSSS